MNQNAKNWVKALRSGEFAQGRGRLKRGDTYCCLGVACELYRREHPEIVWEYNGILRKICITPDLVTKWLGLNSNTADFILGGECTSLMKLNDAGLTFKEIADIIKSEPEGLFQQ